MKIKKFFFYIFLFFICSNFSYSTDKKDLAGIWQGVLNFSGVELRLVFNVKLENDILKATLDSPDQGAKNIPVDTVIFNDTSIRFEVKVVQGYFEGKIREDSLIISGKWFQGGAEIPVDLKKVEKVEEAKRPQHPVPPYPYKEEDVFFQNIEADIRLGGTFTYPDKGGPFPAVILVSGSGWQDRDETLLNHKPFLVLSDYLTRNGIAVLRYDDRGGGKSTGNFGLSTTKDFALDAVSAVNYLLSRKEVDKERIGIAGHSEGGLIAPMASLQSKDVSFIVLMAGPGITGENILILQSALIEKASGESDDKIKKSNEINKKMYKILLEETDSLAAENKIRTLYNDYYNSMTDEEKQKEISPEMFMKQQYKVLQSPWFKYFLKYDPAPTLSKVNVPVLAINGEKDLQVPPKENLSAIENALKEGGNKNFKVIEMPGLNHLFQKSETGAPSEYSKSEETFSPDAMKIIADWIKSLK